jgi:hypothetical protein
MLHDSYPCVVSVSQGMPAAAAGGFGHPVGGGNWGGAPQQQAGGGATTFAGAGAADGCQSAVLAVFQSVNTEQGMHVEEVRLSANPAVKLLVMLGARGCGVAGPTCRSGLVPREYGLRGSQGRAMAVMNMATMVTPYRHHQCVLLFVSTRVRELGKFGSMLVVVVGPHIATVIGLQSGGQSRHSERHNSCSGLCSTAASLKFHCC